MFQKAKIDLHSCGARGITYTCSGPGAPLSIPHDGHGEDIVRLKSFEDYIRDDVASWFDWSQKNVSRKWRSAPLSLPRIEFIQVNTSVACIFVSKLRLSFHTAAVSLPLALARIPFCPFPSLLQPLGLRQNGLNVEHMGDLILVIVCTLVTSWVAAAFLDCSGAAEALKFPWSKGLVRKG